jgi:hypothetical protein
MEVTLVAQQIELRRDTASNWSSVNPTLAQAEPGYETDTGKLKIGDGTTAWNSLAYFAGGVSSSSDIDGGTPTSTYDPITNIDGGTP